MLGQDQCDEPGDMRRGETVAGGNAAAPTFHAIGTSTPHAPNSTGGAEL